MKYLLLITEEPRDWPRAELGAALEQHGTFIQALQEADRFLETGRLAPARRARTTRLDAQMRRHVTDGPFAETKEVVTGYYLIEADSLDEATAWAERLPLFLAGGGVEVREVLTDPTETDAPD